MDLLEWVMIPRLYMAKSLTVNITLAVVTLLMTGVAAANNVRFVEVSEQAGLDFTHVNGMIGNHWLVEITGAGVAILDFDGDGRMDIWIVQGDRKSVV